MTDAHRITLDPDPFDQFNIALGYRVGGLVIVSGQASIDEAGDIVGVGDFDAQAEQTFANLRRVLEAGGSGLDKIVKVTIYLTDMANFPKIVDLRAKYFTRPGRRTRSSASRPSASRSWRSRSRPSRSPTARSGSGACDAAGVSQQHRRCKPGRRGEDVALCLTPAPTSRSSSRTRWSVSTRICSVAVPLARGRTSRARTRVICSLERTLTPAEQSMVALGEHQRLRETRMFFQHAREGDFREAVERVTGRNVVAFVSGIDTTADMSCEVFYLEPVTDGGTVVE